MDLLLLVTEFGRGLMILGGALIVALTSLLFLMRHHHRDEETGLRPPRNLHSHDRHRY
jgi:hypothetical protein